ncbi:UDP-glucose 4-epimerase [Geothrix limicola]|uniref:UDP-glucose 4-epimerase n=1 Tax=Geothrix limicola TaxID=2927978 RepID=A0ABQ5QJQ9_9BACT|nr:polysaccharide biosynthesis protein [Geothrix limicola]GLH74837.1 UDP-glucose 4-epimerase [Geothrix limicola]
MSSHLDLKNETLLITGGTGSFGNVVLRKYLSTDIGEIRIFSRDEKKQDDMRHHYKDDRIKYYIGDIRDPGSVLSALRGVDYIFHAAALKQVPSCEFYPMEAVRTNVLGTSNLLQAAIQAQVKRVVCLSTDKAVYPINAMGISKAMMEKVAIAESRNLGPKGPVICVTRYGNVMASRGSVIPLFLDQIREGKPMTVTDPAMTRFLMHLDTAVELVEFAFSHGHNGDTFVRKSPASTILDLAQAVKELLQADNEIQVIGTRHGEKRYESLLSREERVRSEDLGDYFRVPADSRDLNYSKYFSVGDLEVSQSDEYHSHNAQRLDLSEVKELLLTLSCVQEAMTERGIKSEFVR